MNHTTSINELTEDKCDCETKNCIPFLDTSISIEDGKNSCHPRETTKSIPFSLALRVTGICSKPHTRDIRFQELKYVLLEWNYSSGIIDASIRRARAIPREKALLRVAKPNQHKKPVYAVSWDP